MNYIEYLLGKQFPQSKLNLPKAQTGLQQLEGFIDSWLGYPQVQARKIAVNAGIRGGGKDDEFADSVRHANAGRLTAAQLQSKISNYVPNFVSAPLAFAGANALGVGHELSTLLGDKRPWSEKLREAGEDIYNNSYGAKLGALGDPKGQEKIEDAWINNRLPDGQVWTNNSGNGYMMSNGAKGFYKDADKKTQLNLSAKRKLENLNQVQRDGTFIKPKLKTGGCLPKYQTAGKTNKDYVYEQWKKSLPENLREESPYYNLRGAWEAGLQPEFVMEDMSFHLGSRNPKTGEILKDPRHDTYMEAIEGDIKMGYTPMVDVKTGKIYTINSNNPVTEGPFKNLINGTLKTALPVNITNARLLKSKQLINKSKEKPKLKKEPPSITPINSIGSQESKSYSDNPFKNIANNIQTTLDVAQFVPFVAGPAYLLSLPFTAHDVGTNFIEGNKEQALRDAVGFIPTLKAFQIGKNADKILDTTSKLAKQYKKINGAVNTFNLVNDTNKESQNKKSNWEIIE